MSLLEINNLTKRFPNGKLILDNISLNLDNNKIVTLIGPSGEGKTTLLKVINMLSPFNEGEIIVDGFVMNELNNINRLIQSRIGLVFQDYNLFPHLTVLDNLNLAQVKVLRKDKQSATAKSLEMLEKVGILDKKDEYPSTLSGGESQRVAIARALCLEPKILCFDEPTAALDPVRTKEVANLIKSLKNDDTLILIVTHDIMLLKEVSDQVVFLKNGKIIFNGNLDELKTSDNEIIKNFMI